MTYKETIEVLDIAKVEVEWEYPIDYAVAFGIAKKALEKQIRKSPILFTEKKIYKNNKVVGIWEDYSNYKIDDTLKCGNCENNIKLNQNYCSECGCKIVWSGQR